MIRKSVRCYNPNARQDRSDLVVSAFVLSDIPSDVFRKAIIDNLWAHTSDTLVLIDRGTPYGSLCIREARAHLLARLTDQQEAFHIVAPCNHEAPCPMQNVKSWCHFSQRVRLAEVSRDAKGTKTNHEDSKYAYVVFRRGPRPLVGEEKEEDDKKGKDFVRETYAWPRLVQAPMKRDKHVILDLCASSGILIDTKLSNRS
jgi:ribosomal protein RSM22 (predicted rRNA methylase)